MIYLSGTWSRALAEVTTGADPIGVIVTPEIHGHPDWYLETAPRGWAADNGCFARPEAFDLDRYLAWLDRLAVHGGTCLFAAAPDVVGDAEATWHRSAPVLPLIRRLRLPVALVAQDGFEADAVDWDAFDALFLGGTTRWKENGSQGAAQAARNRGKWLHMGRVNSLRRLQIARELGCSSVDGTFLAFGPGTNLPRLRRMMARCASQEVLFPSRAVTPQGPVTRPRPEGLAAAVLARLEWSVACGCCPVCGAWRAGSGKRGCVTHEHRPGCDLARALGREAAVREVP